MAINFIQLLILVTTALYLKKGQTLVRLIPFLVLIGVMVGVPIDYLLGLHLGLFSHELGFGVLFIVSNGALSYGLFAAHVFLLKDKKLLMFILAIMAIALIYEVSNLLFPMWSWQMNLPLAALFVIVASGYLAGALTTALVTSITKTTLQRFTL